ncbi:MAG: transglycosylase domain-containing protein [Actinomycetota bacterium]
MRSFPARRALPLFVVLVLLTVSCAQLQDLPTLKEGDLGIKLAQSSRIYDGEGGLITSVHGPEDRTSIRLDRIPQYLIDAVIAIEDERFYEHDGVDVRAILRALASNVAEGGIREGGSTITQQYVKNVLIAPGETAARTLERKIDEAALARQVEQKLTKDQILQRYLNTVYFGAGAYGVQAASKTYFGKPARKLELHEAAMLAGLVQAPSDYDPFQRPQAAIDRRNVVLRQMAETGHIGDIEAAAASGKKLGLTKDVEEVRYPAPYFIDYVQRLLTYDPRFEIIGKTPSQREQQLFQGGLRIYTTLDRSDQAAAEEAVNSVLPNESDPTASLVAIDPDTGHVKAMVGGRDWFVRKKKDPYAKLNLAIQAEPNLACERYLKGRRADQCKDPYEPAPAPGTGRQAGSAFKPFALAQAIREGIPLSKRYKAGQCIDLVVPGTGQSWRPCNYEGSAFGKISLLEATVNSVNTVYAQLILEVGPQDVVDLAHDMGINTPLAANPSLVLGANEVNPLGMASAYATFAANGTLRPPVAITKIVNARGKVLYKDETQAEKALDPAIAYLSTTAMQQIVERGTGVRAGLNGRPAAGKTGTAQEYRDAWFGGYTPNLSAAVWVGYPGGQIEMKASCAGSTRPCRPTRLLSGGRGVTGGSFPAAIWSAFMNNALAGEPAKNFRNPGAGLVTVKIDTRTGCLADRFTPKDARSTAMFPQGTEPTESSSTSEECRVGKDRVSVPDVFGFPVKQAVAILRGDGFDVERIEEESVTYPPGRVIGQSPVGGTKAPRGSTITLVVSVASSGSGGGGGGGGGGNNNGGNGSGSGSQNKDDRVTVPNVLGLTQKEAVARLNEAGFQVTTYYEKESDKKQAKERSGRVWKQSPGGGEKAKRGTKVNIWVNP